VKAPLDVAVLFTATVRINSDLAGVTAADPRRREEEYAENLRYFLREHPRLRKLVFAENSGWPLDRLREIAATENPHGKEVELLQLSCNDFPGSYGKGYGEALLLDRALAASRLARETRWIAKMTGRQRVLNMTRLLERAPARFDLLCDLRDHGLFERFGIPAAGRWCDTRFFVFTLPFFDTCLRRLYTAPRPDGQEYNLEGSYYDAVKALEADPRGFRIVARFPLEPRYRGHAGHWHKDYGSLRQRVKQSARAIARHLLPGVRF
jgi:hypothetical protein